jgi:hypothetical protein
MDGMGESRVRNPSRNEDARRGAFATRSSWHCGFASLSAHGGLKKLVIPASPLGRFGNRLPSLCSTELPAVGIKEP